MENKTALRIEIKNKRKLLDRESASKSILEKIRKHPAFINSKNVMLFYPTRYEINLLDLMDTDGKNFYFPKVDGENMLVCPNNGDFEKSELNIYEPYSNPVDGSILDLIIVPALAVDKNNYRLGYGGGFYDRFLAKFNRAKTIAPVFKELLVDSLPVEDYDIPVDFVIAS